MTTGGVQGDVSHEGGLPGGAQHGQEVVESEEQESGGHTLSFEHKTVTVM